MLNIKKIIASLSIVSVLLGTNPVTPLYLLNSTVLAEEPAQPSQPSQPTGPTAPTSPSQPSDPATPTNPEQPTAPTSPTSPTQPGSSTPTPTPSPAETTDTTDQSSPTDTSSNLVITETGDEKQTDGMGDTTVNSGDANAIGTLQNNVNTNIAGVQTGTGSTGTSIINEGNNSGSTNVTSADTSEVTTTTQTNNAVITNEAHVVADSGDNTVRNNVGGDVLIQSGDANTALTVVNQVNTNITGANVVEFNVVEDHVGDIIIDFTNPCATGGCVAGIPTYLANTGNNSDSTNVANSTDSQETNTFQGNDATVENTIILEADSGHNLASDIVGGDVVIETGDANVSANVVNFVNNNIAGNVYMGVVNIFGDLTGDLILPEQQAGSQADSGTTVSNTNNNSDSDNFASVDNSVLNEVTQENTANVTNNLTISADTGDNAARDNVNGNNNVETGDANVVAQVLNVVNNNVLNGDWWVVLVNEAGNWIGKIVGSDENANFAGSAGTDFTVNPDGTVNVSNSGNNTGSQNTASSTSSVENTLTQQNNGSVTNNLELTANTGSNTVKDVAGGDKSIQTGDANVVASVVNFLNNNFAGGRVYLTVVNVFGKWMGDFVAPGQEKTADTSQNGNHDNTSQEENTSGVGGSGDFVAQNNNSETSKTETTQNLAGSEVVVPEVLGTKKSSLINHEAPIAFTNANLDSVATITPMPEDEETAGKKVVKLNLAWLFLLTPALLVPISRKRNKNTLPKKGYDKTN